MQLGSHARTHDPLPLARSLARLKSTAVAVGRSVVRMHAARCMGEGATETCFVRFEGTVLQWDTSVRDMIQTMLFILLSCPIDIMSGSLPPFLSDDEFYANEHVSRYLGGADDPRLTDAARCCFAKRISIAFSLPSHPRSLPLSRPLLLRSREHYVLDGCAALEGSLVAARICARTLPGHEE